MISKWDIRDNNVTSNSVYMLVVQGSDDDAVILEKSLSGFAKLIDAKVSPFTHTFELLNITDDDMLQKIRARIEQMANESSLGNQTACEETHEEASVLPKDKTNAVSSSQTQEEAADILKMIDDNNPAALERDAASVRVASGDLAVERSEDNFNIGDMELEQDLEVGDGTLINLSAEETRQIKDVSGFGQEYFDNPDANIKKDPIQNRETVPPVKLTKKNIIMPLVPGFEEKKDNESVSSEPAPKEEEDSLQGAPPVNPEKRGFFAKLFTKLHSAKNKPLENSDAIQSINKNESSQSLTKETDAYKNAGKLGNDEIPGHKQQSVVVGETISSQLAMKSLNNSKTKGQQQNPDVQKDKSAADSKYIPLRVIQDSGLTARIPVDDIFAAETIVDFYGDKTGLENISSEDDPSQIIPAMPQGSFPLIGDDLMDIPSNILSSSVEEKVTEPKAAQEAKDESSEIKKNIKPAGAMPNSDEKPRSVSSVSAMSKVDDIDKKDYKPDEQIQKPVSQADEMIDLTQRHIRSKIIDASNLNNKTQSDEEFNIYDVAKETQNLEDYDIEEIESVPTQESTQAQKENVKKQEETAMQENEIQKEKIIEGNEQQKSAPPAPQVQPVLPKSPIQSDIRPPQPPAAAPAKPVSPEIVEKPAAPVPSPQPPAAAPAKPVSPEIVEKPAAPVPSPKPSVAPPKPAPPAVPAMPVVPITEPLSKPAAPVTSAKSTTLAEITKADLANKTLNIDRTIHLSMDHIYKRSNWSIEIPLIPTFTFSTMDMASNRFSHANAMSVVENIGTLYNPFFIFGEAGCGKTHFLHAIGYEISKKIPQEKIFITNGVRFARGIQRYIEENKTQKLQEMFSSVEVLIIDDIHLTAINDFNKEVVSKILNRFIGEYKQIVISSKYPPESLTRFEELINFKLSQGWVSELKPPRKQHLSRIYNKMSDVAGLGLTEAMAQTFFGGENLTLGEIAKNIKRVKVLHKRIIDSGSPEKTYGELLTEMLSVSGENEKSEIIKKDIPDIKTIVRMENAEWGNFGFFYPRGQEDKFNWISFAIMQKAKELGIRGGLRFSLKSAYSTENIISSAFKIANICDNKNLKGAIILGPSISSMQTTIRENFYDILSHMLEVMMIRCGIIDAENIKRPSEYMLALGDVIK